MPAGQATAAPAAAVPPAPAWVGTAIAPFDDVERL
jgi:hypothetical protein